MEKTAIPARETTILWATPKMKKNPSSQPPNMTIGKMGKLALMNRLRTKTRGDSNYLPPSEDEASLGDEDFIVPEEPLEQERFKQRLIATARNLKKK